VKAAVIQKLNGRATYSVSPEEQKDPVVRKFRFFRSPETA
jgi:hypothetical protein